MDEANKNIQEWGTISVSDVILLPLDGQLKLEDSGFPKSTSDYVSGASSVQGSASQYVSQILSMGMGLSATPTLAPSTNPTSVPSGVTPTAAPQLSSNNPTALMSNLPSASLSEEDLNRIGINTKVDSEVNLLLTNPPHIPHRQAYLAVCMISCHPGWRTRTDYTGRTTVTFDYQYQQRYGTQYFSALRSGHRVTPGVYSILPIADSQTLNLSSEKNNSFQFYSALSALFTVYGQNANAQAALNYAKESDNAAKTVSPIPINSSDANGGSFGYEFAPEFQALEDPSDPDSKPQNVLNSVGFPVAALIVVNGKDLPVRLYDGTQALDTDGSPIIYNNLAANVTSTWMLRKHDDFFPKETFDISMHEKIAEELADARIALNRARKALYPNVAVPGLVQQPEASDEPPVEKHPYADSFEDVQRRFDELSSRALGHTAYCPLLPPPAEDVVDADPNPQITRIIPKEAMSDVTNTVVIEGNNFPPDPKENIIVSFAGQRASVIAAQTNFLVVSLPPFKSTAVETVLGSFQPAVLFPSKGLAESSSDPRLAEITFEVPKAAATSDPSNASLTADQLSALKGIQIAQSIQKLESTVAKVSLINQAVAAATAAQAAQNGKSTTATTATAYIPAFAGSSATDAIPAFPGSSATPATATMPALPAIPAFPSIPSLPAVPAVPEIGAIPAIPALPATPQPPIPAIPQIPAIPALPSMPSFPSIPAIPNIPAITEVKASGSNPEIAAITLSNASTSTTAIPSSSATSAVSPSAATVAK